MSGIVYERDTCSRCGGSGSYSFNPRDGSRCFGCGGSGRRITRRGKRAHALVQKRRDKVYGRPAREVKVGDKVWVEGFVPCPGLPIPGRRARFRTVQEIEPDGDQLSFVYVIGDDRFHVTQAPDTIVRVFTEAGWEAVLDYAAKLKGATVERSTT